MFASTFIVAALASTVVVNAAPVVARAQPSTWANEYLEEYDTYHTRYLALNCHDKHNTTFFAQCCHPLLSTETLEDQPAYCTPNATAVASAIAYNATATATAESEDQTEFASATASLDSIYSSVAAATSTSAAATSTSSDLTVNNYVAPTTTSTWSAAAETTSASSGSSSVQTGGYATYFYQGGNPGACGNYNSDSGLGIAIDANGWWPNYNSGTSDHCGKWITITNTNNGKSVTAQVWDVCPTCTNDNSLDLSVGAFTAIASESDGMVPISWVWA